MNFFTLLWYNTSTFLPGSLNFSTFRCIHHSQVLKYQVKNEYLSGKDPDRVTSNYIYIYITDYSYLYPLVIPFHGKTNVYLTLYFFHFTKYKQITIFPSWNCMIIYSHEIRYIVWLVGFLGFIQNYWEGKIVAIITSTPHTKYYDGLAL